MSVSIIELNISLLLFGMVSIFVGDDGEEFKVKKSSYSKKIKKQMSKEKMGRDKIENGKKSKVIICDTIRPIVRETQTNFNVIHNLFLIKSFL